MVPLTHSTWKNIPWNLDESCKLAFLTLKQAFISTPVLTHYKPSCPLVIETDASDYALAAILSQVESNREIHPVTYLSWTFLDTNSTTTHMTRNSWQFMKHSRLGNTTLKAPKF
jgi:RNase H-like domain found in reverse transcriptase